MGLLDRAAQEAGRFASTQEFGIAATYLPDGKAPGFACVLSVSDETNPIQLDGGDLVSDRIADAFARRSVLRSGIGTQTGTTREPRRGDQVEIASGACAGRWAVRSARLDDGDGVQLELRLTEYHGAGGAGAIQDR